MRTRHLAIGVGTTILTCLFLFGVLEGMVRMANPQPPIQIPTHKNLFNRGQFTKPGIHRNQSNEYSVQVHVNQYGFVDQNWKLPNPDSTLLVGDSFVQAAQVDLPNGLGRQLQTSMQQPVLSIGVPGAGTTTAYLLLKNWLPKIQPRRVLIGILLSNDILNNHQQLESKTDKPFATVENGNLILQSQSIPTLRFSELLLKQSHGIRWLERTLNRQSQIKHKTTHTPHPLDFEVYLSQSEQSSDAWTESWTVTGELLKEIQQLCQNQTVEVYFVLFPSYEEISRHRQTELIEQYPSLKAANFLGPHDTLIDDLTTLGVDEHQIIDLYPTFVSHSKPDTLYFSQDGHWTSSGHQLAAQSIAQHLSVQE